MKTRCKPGDIAVIIGTGKIVSVIRRYVNGEIVSGTDWVDSSGELGPAWVVESLGSPIQNHGSKTGLPWGDLMVVVRTDTSLLPLRKKRGEDQMLRITGKPKVADKVIVPAVRNGVMQ